jgi:hypothetical protein
MRRGRVLAAACVGTLLIPGIASPIVTRHDVADARFLELAGEFPSLATLRSADGEVIHGQGTLIDARWVLTAAHVAAEVSAGDLAEIGARRVRIARVIKHPSWTRVADLKVDIAMIRLESPIMEVAPAALFAATDEGGLDVVFAGRGSTGSGLTGPERDDFLLRAAQNRVISAEGPFLGFRFDAPGDPGVSELEGISGPGDSGGPAYAMRDGRLYVIGVSSWQDSRPTQRQQGRYGVIEYYTRVSFFREWIVGVMAADQTMLAPPAQAGEARKETP